LPFSETLQSGLDKVRAALSTSAQRELLARLKELSFHGVPALPSDKKVRAAIERAWFEQQPIRITYVDGNHVESARVIRIQSVMMDRHETRVDGVDCETEDRRHFRLDRIVAAEVLRPETPSKS
jgi:predicted DNA-binding transcriptional regulator YafY